MLRLIIRLWVGIVLAGLALAGLSLFQKRICAQLPSSSVHIEMRTLADYRVALITFLPLGQIHGPSQKYVRRDTYGIAPNASRMELERAIGIYTKNWDCYSKLHNFSLFVEMIDQKGFRDEISPNLSEEEIAKWVGKADPTLRSQIDHELRRHDRLNVWKANWMKPYLMLDKIGQRRFDWFLWFDADAGFILPHSIRSVISKALETQPSAEVIVFDQDLLAPYKTISKALANVCSCVFVVRNSEGGQRFLEKWLAFRRHSAAFSDQGAFIFALFDEVMRFHLNTQHYFNACLPPHPFLHKEAKIKSNPWLHDRVCFKAELQRYSLDDFALLVKDGPVAVSRGLAANVARASLNRQNSLALLDTAPAVVHFKMTPADGFRRVALQLQNDTEKCPPTLASTSTRPFLRKYFGALGLI